MEAQKEFRLRKKEEFIDNWDYWIQTIETGLEKLKELVLEAFEELEEE